MSATSDSFSCNLQIGTEWVIFGFGDGSDAPPGRADLAAAPDRLRLGRCALDRRPCHVENNEVNVSAVLGWPRDGQSVYVYIPLLAPGAGRYRVAVGADGVCQAWVDGHPVGVDALYRPAVQEVYPIECELGPGAHTLALRVVALHSTLRIVAKQATESLLAGGFGRLLVSTAAPRVLSLRIRGAQGDYLDATDVFTYYAAEFRNWALRGRSYLLDADWGRYECGQVPAAAVSAAPDRLCLSGVRLVRDDGVCAPVSENWTFTVGEGGRLRWSITRQWEAAFAYRLSCHPGVVFRAAAGDVTECGAEFWSGMERTVTVGGLYRGGQPWDAD